MRSHRHPDDRQLPTGAAAPRSRRARAVVPGIVGSALLLAACGSSSSSSTTSTTRVPATTTTTTAGTTTSTTRATTTTTTGPKSTSCTTSNLTVTLGSPDGTAGAIHYAITFHNSGSSPCTLYGYPGVSFLTAGGSQIGAPAQREGNLTPATVTLSVGGDAYSSVAVTDPGIPPCSSSVNAAQARIYPPGETQAALAAAPAGGIAVCGSPNTANYQSAIVSPVSATSV